jgi:hypothetical protein
MFIIVLIDLPISCNVLFYAFVAVVFRCGRRLFSSHPGCDMSLL